jgi:N-acetylglutamate synthase-like GNAT family acetyltransferase
VSLQPVHPDTPAYAAMVIQLAAANLPTSDLGEGTAKFFALDGGTAYGGLAAYGSVGLLRSLVVSLEQRGKGAGSVMLAHLLEQARASGVRDMWLLTTSGEAFFARHGFVPTDRNAAPAIIAETSQFRDLCPASAALMHKQLA